MAKRYISTLSVICCFFLFFSCSRENYIDPMADDGGTPSPVTQVAVKPLPGAAVLRYKLPQDGNLRYVKAVFEIRPGVERETIASLYQDSLIVDGFPDVKEYEVQLYTVSYGEKRSEPVTVKITPLTSPLQEAHNTFRFEETFGGTTISFDNSGEASLAVTILTPDSTGILKAVQTYYTKSREGRFSVRGFADEPRLFGAVIRDRWGNLSDTLTQTLTPVFEELIPKNLFKGLVLPTDVVGGHANASWTLDKIWDDKYGAGSLQFHTKPGSGIPQWFTFDMGRPCLLSRYKFYHRAGSQYVYQLGAPRKWEVWGTAGTPDPSGSWNGWVKLMDCESYKPSGEGPVTAEDVTYAVDQGEDFIFPEQIPVRYLRFKVNETWGFLDYIYIAEVTFWGDADITP
ncbi:DUF5000 domain-containing lipoprotein [Niabella beijingensis]|uniref:DUF5000 domain-containing lipoprotein n=1 Tax=Niabella beijingensis TaxID=2872700 RepID=UPI001CBC7577|nr:DUF5000 domain-containing lipoprotein [Niabella beijingensis]MBZ4187562.1 DUF4959 domain-containing protein [Niabella beijingensis]